MEVQLHPFLTSPLDGGEWSGSPLAPPFGRVPGIYLIILGQGFESWQGLGIFLFATASRPADAQPAFYPMRIGALSLAVKRPGREANHSSASSDEVKEWVEIYLHFLNTPSWGGVHLQAQGQLYLYLLLVCRFGCFGYI
jgi:hypothetical protein